MVMLIVVVVAAVTVLIVALMTVFVLVAAVDVSGAFRNLNWQWYTGISAAIEVVGKNTLNQ